MNLLILGIVAGSSAISTIVGFISSFVKNRRSRNKDAPQQYTLTITKDGKVKEYRIESSSREAAETEIKNLIERSE